MTAVVLIQARTNSSRLPAKVLLPINGVPIVVLAAQRAANLGAKVVVLTSEECSDDLLCSVLGHHGVDYFRGSLHSPLERFVSALVNYDDEQLIIRLTADNVFPDGGFLSELEEYFNTKGLDYLLCNGEDSGLPYGVSAEITRVGLLRETLAKEGAFEGVHEHVTTYIRSKYGKSVYIYDRSNKHYGKRCTIDNLSDYLKVASFFSRVLDPVSVSLNELLEEFEVKAVKAVDKLVLGTAQLGLDYGVSNSSGMPTSYESRQLLTAAYFRGVSSFDTASSYGLSEDVLGNAFENSRVPNKLSIYTKLSTFEGIGLDGDTHHSLVERCIESSIYKSLYKLKVDQIECVMLHRFEHLISWNQMALVVLKRFMAEGRVASIGVSVQSPSELLSVLDVSDVSVIQMPFNLLDYRWDDAIEKIQKIQRQRELTIHVRSVYLQGVLLSDDDAVWQKAGITSSKTVRGWLHSICKRNRRESVADLCLAYVRSLEWVGGVVIGMETIKQLNENAKLFSEPLLDVQSLKLISETRPVLEECNLNPAMWDKE